MSARIKVLAVVAAVLVGVAGANLLEAEVSDSAAGVLYLGNGKCTGVEEQPEDNLKCAVELTLSGGSLPWVQSEAAASLSSLDFTRVEAVEMTRCPKENATNPDASVAGVGGSPAGWKPCRVHEGADKGMSLHDDGTSELGIVSIDGLLRPPVGPAGTTPARRTVWLLSTNTLAMALVENATSELKTEIALTPGSGAALSLTREQPISLQPGAQRIVVRTPATGPVRVNLQWRSLPTSLWTNVRLAAISGPLSSVEKSGFDWLGREYSPSHGRIRIEGPDLEAHVAPGCDGACFKVTFNSSHAVIRGEGVTIEGTSFARKQWFQSFAAISGLVVALVALVLG